MWPSVVSPRTAQAVPAGAMIALPTPDPINATLFAGTIEVPTLYVPGGKYTVPPVPVTAATAA